MRSRPSHASLLPLLLLLPLACDPKSSGRPPPRSRAAVPDAPLPPADAPVAPAEEIVTAPTPVPPLGDGARIEDERNTIAVFRAAAPATVFVTQKKVVRDRWSLNAMEIPAGSGTGFIWDASGHVVTNFHVIAKGHSFEVTLHDGSTHEARLVGGDPNKDIAVLALTRVPATLQALELPPEGAQLEVGQKTLAIGNPFGLDHTLTTGVISALGRDVMGYGGVTIRDMIQTDASINPGNSGGPLLDSAGRLIGMNTMIFSQSGSSAGIGFAVPVATIRKVVTDILEHGQTQRAGLGIDRVPDHVARQNGIEGVVIRAVLPQGPADLAGLRGLADTPRGTMLGDVIIGIDDQPIRSFDDLFNALDTRAAGEQVTVKILRDTAVLEVRVQLTQM